MSRGRRIGRVAVRSYRRRSLFDIWERVDPIGRRLIFNRVVKGGALNALQRVT